MRPAGVIRTALLESARRLCAQYGEASWREIADEAELQVEADDGIAGERLQRGIAHSVARDTINMMVRAGQLQVIGRKKLAGSTQWHAMYAPVESDPGDSADSTHRLENLLSEVGVFG